MKIKVFFDHGLGDCVHFAHILPLYTRRGYEFSVTSGHDKHVVFQQPGVVVAENPAGAIWVPWNDAGSVDSGDPSHFWEYNKAAINIGTYPLPYIGSSHDLWEELCDVRLDLSPCIPRQDWCFVRDYVGVLPKPLILIHSLGNTNQESKSIPDNVVSELYRKLLDRTDGTLILLDWDDRVPRLPHWRVRHLSDDWTQLTTTQLLALMREADLLVGVDSGPLHLARFTNLPTVGYFPNGGHFPSRFCLPRSRQVNVVSREHTHEWNCRTRVPYNIVECPGDSISAEFLSTTCLRMLAGPRYLDDAHLGADVQLQQFVLDWERGDGNFLTPYADRHRSLDLLLQEARRRFHRPLILETGCIRSPEDWGGAGFATYLFATFLQSAGGSLVSVDHSLEYCEFAREICAGLANTSVQCADSVSFLRDFVETVDVLYLDSADAELPHAADHALEEIEAGLHLLHDQSLVVFDDTVFTRGTFIGKGAKAVPWLLERGWRVFFSGYQTICSQRDQPARLS